TTEVLLRYDGASLGLAFAAPFTKTASLMATVPFFIRDLALQTSTGATPTCTSTTTASCFENVNNGAFTQVGGIAVGASDPGANWTYSTMSAGTVSNALDYSPPQAAPTLFGGTGPQSVSIVYQANTAA